MKYKITVNDETYFLEKGIMVIGRGAEADIKVKSKNLSRAHARLMVEGDKLQVEDLGSKNGTFVNNDRIDGAREISTEDAIRFADTTIRIENIMPASTVIRKEKLKAEEAKHDAAQHMVQVVEEKRGARSANPRLVKHIKNAVAVVILLIIGLIVWRMLPEDDTLELIKEDLRMAHAIYDGSAFEEIEDIDELKAFSKNLDKAARSIRAVESRFTQEYEDANELLDRIDKRQEALNQRIAALENAEQLKERYKAIMADHGEGRADGPRTVALLEVLVTDAEGSRLAEIYGKKVRELKVEVIEAVNRQLDAKAGKAEDFVNAQKFGAALAALEEDITVPYPDAAHLQLARLKEVRALIPAAFDKALEGTRSRVMALAEEGKYDEALASLNQDSAKWNYIPGEGKRRAIIDAVKQVRDKMLAEAIKQIEAEMNAARADFDIRNYTRAAEQFKRIAANTNNALVKKEVNKSYLIAVLLADAKKELIGVINKDGLDFKSVGGGDGRIVQAETGWYYVEIEENRVGFKWKVLRNTEFAKALMLVLGEQARPVLAAGILLAMESDTQGRRELLKAAQLSPDLKTEFSWIFDEMMAAAPAAEAAPAGDEKRWKDSPAQTDPNGSTPDEVILEESTLICLGVRWPIKGDANHNAIVTFEFREKGQKKWRRGLDLRHCRTVAMKRPVAAGISLYAGSIFELKEATVYELRLRLVDPDGGRAERRLEARTKAEPKAFAGGKVLHAVPVGGRAGGFSPVYKGLEAAQAAAKPGDIILVHKGVYKGQFSVNKFGEPGKPIVWRGAGDGEAIIDPEKKARRGIYAHGSHDLHFENLTIRNTTWGIAINNSWNIAIKRCRIYNCDYGIAGQVNANGVNRNFYIADNDFKGPSTWPRTKGIEGARGVQIAGQGHTVCYNRISAYADAIDTIGPVPTHAIDIYGNELSECTDDGIETDYSEYNVRVFRNRLTNMFQAISTQPIYGGPIYIFRNAMYNIEGETFKMHNNPYGALFMHNTSVKTGMPLHAYGGKVQDMYYRNNIFIGTQGNYAFEYTGTMDGCDYDYNGWSGKWGRFGKWGGKVYTTLQELQSKEGQCKNAIMLSAAKTFASKILPPRDARAQQYEIKVNDLRLNPGSKAIDAGMVLPNINDNFKGKAPDLGAYELGDPLPHYGPRAE